MLNQEAVMHTRGIIMGRAAGVAVAMLVLTGFLFSVKAQTPTGNADRGKELFTKTGCYQCHGYSAQGATTGVRLAPLRMTFLRLTRYVKAPTGRMPPYTAAVLSEQDLADIYAFLGAIPAPPDLDDIPLLALSQFEPVTPIR
jgi:mono/diheme cytochrome c family protein